MSDRVLILAGPQTVLITQGANQGPQGPGVGGAGGAHNDLTGRDAALAHPIAAIDGLQAALDGKAAAVHNHDGSYEPVGTAAGAVAAHEAAPDPHPQYATSAEVASAIATKLDDLPAGTADAIVTAGADGTTLGRAVHTIASLLAAARDRASHTGSQLASTISDFAAQVLALLSWGNISGKPSTFPPESHTHAAAQVSDSTATGRAVMTAADAAAARTAIGAESAGAAAAAVSAHEAALDPHTQYTTAAEAAAAAPVQSVAGRTGAVTLSTSDVSGLGGAATLNVGTTAGTVAAGNDARLSDARTPTAHTHPLGDLQQSGAASGNVPTWNGSAWVPQAPAGGSPGGSSGQVQYNNSGSFGGMSGVTWDAINSRISFGAGASPTGKVHVQSGAASEVGLIVQGAASQTAALQEWRDSAGTVLSSITTNRRINFGPAYVGIGSDTNFIHIAPGGSVSMNVVTNRIEANVPIVIGNGAPGIYRRAIGSIPINTIPGTGSQGGGGGRDLAFSGTNGLNNNTAANREADGFTFITGNGGAPLSGDANGGDGGNFNVALGAAGAGSGSGSPGAPGRLIVKDRSGNIRFSVDEQGNVFFGALPTSSAGLPAGSVWNDGGTLKVVV